MNKPMEPKQSVAQDAGESTKTKEVINDKESFFNPPNEYCDCDLCDGA